MPRKHTIRSSSCLGDREGIKEARTPVAGLLIKESEGLTTVQLWSDSRQGRKSNKNMPPNTVLVQLRYPNPSTLASLAHDYELPVGW